MKRNTVHARETKAKPKTPLKKAEKKAAKKAIKKTVTKKAAKKVIKKAAKKTVKKAVKKTEKTPLVSYSQQLSAVVVKGMQEKKAQHIVVMDLRKVKNAIADFFILASGTSDKHLEAIADSVEAEVFKNLGESPWHTEGKSNKEWMLIDYADVVAHIFRKDRRNYYAIEDLWGDADVTEFSENNS